MRCPTAVAATAEWNGKEKSCSVPTAAYPPAVDTIMFRVWRTPFSASHGTGAHGAVAAADGLSVSGARTRAARRRRGAASSGR